ncbi:hypothetical protein DFJ77DRAFT_476775 [Powellomyces hirtus]|nr:hypothetical protein DFJ77DRAFT_476775 [Powellomyces hirtus]
MDAKKKAADIEAGGGGDYNPTDLAAEARKIEFHGNFLSKIKLPLWLVLSGIFVLILATVVVPSSIIFITNAYSNSEDSAQSLTYLTLDSAFSSVNNLLVNNRRVAYNWGRHSRTTEVIKEAAANLSVGALWPRFQGDNFLKDAIALTRDQDDISSIFCVANTGPAENWRDNHMQFGVDKWTIKSLMPIVSGPAGNLTDLERLLPHGAYWTFGHMEMQMRNTNMKRALDQTAQPISAQTYMIIMQGYSDVSPLTNISNFNRMARATPWLANQWTLYNNSVIGLPANMYNSSLDPVYLNMRNGVLKDGQVMWSYTNLYGKTYAGASVAIYSDESYATHACQAGGILQESLDNYLAKLIPSENGVIFLFDAKGSRVYRPGSLLAGSIVNAGINMSAGLSTALLTMDNAWYPPIANVGKYLVQGYPNLAMLASSGPQALKTKLGDGKDWYIGVRQIAVDDTGNLWTLVVAFPRSDFFASIDRSITKSLIVIVVLAAVGLLVTFGISFAFTIPLRILGTYMTEATGMKFKFLEGGKIEDRSMISEIARLQAAFGTMVKAFAAGIRKNASLVGTRAATRGAGGGSHSQSQAGDGTGRNGSVSQQQKEPLLKNVDPTHI